MTDNPYAASLGDRDPIASLAEVPGRLRALVESMTPADLERSHAPGKWTVRQLLVHLAQTELAFTVRIRMALTTPGYVVQPFDQDRWMAMEAHAGGLEALRAYEALRRLSLPLFTRLSGADRATALHHPERGPITVEWILVALAGHERHHLGQIEQVADVIRAAGGSAPTCG